jgi:RNA polymerase sigma-70 factor (ECF subfamily)
LDGTLATFRVLAMFMETTLARRPHGFAGGVVTELPKADAFEETALPCLPELARFARSLTHDASDADDLVQETYLRAFQAWHTFTPGSDCRRWLFTICRNVWLRTRERAQRVVAVEDPEAETLAAVRLHMSAREAGLNDLYARIDIGPALERALDALPPDFRTVARLVDVDGRSYEEVAMMLDVPIGTVRSRLFRARRLLQESLLVHALDAGYRSAQPRPPART